MPANAKLPVRIAALHLLMFAILIGRRPESLLKPQFWAEDGFIFFAGQMNAGFWHALFIPYSGYLHVVPRILAGLWSALPVEAIPAAYVFSSLVIATLCCGAFAWPCYRWLIASDLLRSLCCLLMASAIPAGGELIGSICNLQWFLAPVALLLAFTRQRSDHRNLVQIATMLTLILIAMSTPVLFVAFPLFLWQVIWKPGWPRWKSLAIILCLGLESLIVLHTNGGGSKGHWNFDSVLIATVAGGLAKCVLTPLFGASYLLEGSTKSFVAKLILALIILAVLLTLLSVQVGSASRRRILLSAIYVGVGSVAIVMGGRNLAGSFFLPADIPHVEGHRYFFLPSCVFVFLAAFGVQFLLDRISDRRVRWLPIALFALSFSLGAVRNFPTPPMADLSWPSHAAEIEHWRQIQRQGQTVAPLVVPVNPPGLTMTLEPHP